MAEAKEKNNVYKIAGLVALSCVLQISESLIPHPIPGLRLGLANVITLITLVLVSILGTYVEKLFFLIIV